MTTIRESVLWQLYREAVDTHQYFQTHETLLNSINAWRAWRDAFIREAA